MLSFRSSSAVRQRLHTLSSTLSRTARKAIDRNNDGSTKNRWLSSLGRTTMSGRGEGRATAVAASSAFAAAPLRPSALGVTRGSCSHHGAPRGSVVGVAGAGAVTPDLLEISSTTADATAAGGGPRGGAWAPAGSAAVAALAAAAVVAAAAAAVVAAAAAAAEPFKDENHRMALAAAALGIEERGTLTRLRGFESLSSGSSSSGGGGGGGGAAASGCHGSDVSGVGGGGDAGGGSGRGGGAGEGEGSPTKKARTGTSGGGGAGVAECEGETDGESAVAEDGILGKYEIGRLLGEGSFGMVYEARPVGSERRVALKQIAKLGVRREEILQEMNTLTAIHTAGGHENIAQVLDVFEDPTYYFFALELVSGGEMFEHLTRNGPYSEATAASFMRELAAALRFLHAQSIIHADLKPENLMLSSWDLGESKLKVVDFGSSKRTGTPIDLANSTLGTTWYLPPEAVWEGVGDSGSPDSDNAGTTTTDSDATTIDPVNTATGITVNDTATIVTSTSISPDSHGGGRDDSGGQGGGGDGDAQHLLASPALDMWAVGCILFIMLCGAHPFDLESDSSEAEVLHRAKEGVVPLWELGTGVSDSAKDLISRLLSKDPRERLTSEEMMRHPWIQGRTAPEMPLKGSDARLARFRQLLSQKLEAGVVSMLVGGAEENNSNQYTCNSYGGQMDKKHEGMADDVDDGEGGAAGDRSLGGVGVAIDVVKNAYKAFDRRGTGKVSATDIAGFLEEHSAQVSDDERRAIDEAVSVAVARHLRAPSGGGKAPPVVSSDAEPDAAPASPLEQLPAPPPPEGGAGGRGGAEAIDGAKVAATSAPGGMEGSPTLPSTTTAETAVAAAVAAAAAATAPPAAGEEGNAAFPTTLGGAPPECGTPEARAGGGTGVEEEGLDMSDFEELLLDHLKTSLYPPGEFVFREGDAPDGGLYFIVEGRVDVLVDSAAGWNSDGGGGASVLESSSSSSSSSSSISIKDVEKDGDIGDESEGVTSPGSAATADSRRRPGHTRVASMGPGDFFGEGGVVSSQPRGESVRAATPVKVINVSLASCHRMIGAPGKVSSKLRRVALSRALFRAKNVVRAVHSVNRRRLGPGEAVFRQGDPGLSLFTVGEGELDVVKEHSGVQHTVAQLSPGSFFGEMALMTSQPRSASVVCSASCEGGCVVDEISGDDFARLLMARKTGFRRDVMRMLRARQFRHGVYKLLTELGTDATFTDQELRQVFDRVDTDKSGDLTLDELKAAFSRADPLLNESAVEEIMTMLDLDAVGSVSFEEFLKIIRWDP